MPPPVSGSMSRVEQKTDVTVYEIRMQLRQYCRLNADLALHLSVENCLNNK